jgi:hypothetical protein
MAFDLAFDFRGSVEYVTDPSYGCGVILSHTYPHTYTASNGNSLNAGWTVAPNSCQDKDATNDPRIAGLTYANGQVGTFQIDLASGSNPGAGSYSIDLAAGDPTAVANVSFEIRDDATALITRSGINTSGADNYVDASLASITATTSWTGTPVTKTFASTTCYVLFNITGSGARYDCFNHFRLTQAAAPATLGASLLLLGIPFIRAGLGIAYSLAVDPLVLHLNAAAVGLQFTSGSGKAYSLAVDPLTLHLNLADVGLTFTAPFQYSLAVDPLIVHLNLADVALAYSPFTPPRALPSTSGRSPYLEYRRHRRMGR